jgi:dTDP-4-dehydrorhamnose reductase
MKILVTGGRGQLGRSITAHGRARGHEIDARDLPELDICLPIDLPPCDLVINAAAYTAVDKAESERERAFAANRDGAANLARACRERGVPFLHVSTDYVFDGASSRPYREDDPIAPLGVYGESKAAGEREVLQLGGTVVRTSWLFAEGGPSFVHSILRLAREQPTLHVVADQHGCPTYAGDLAEALIALRDAVPGVYHYCNDGATTWHAFATAIVAEARARGPIACERIDGIITAAYPTPTRRPAYSVLDTTRVRALGIVPPSWRSGLALVVAHALSKG